MSDIKESNTQELTKNVLVHRFIYDEEQIRKFVEIVGFTGVLHQMFVSARPKYNKDVKFKCRHISPKSFFNSTADRFIELIKKYEIPVGSYTDHDQVLPNDCLVMYCTTNPRNGKRAAQNFIQECLNAAFTEDDYIFQHLYEKLNGAIMASKAKTTLTTIDIDSKEEYKEVHEFLTRENITPRAVVETRGGYHVLLETDVNLGKVYKAFASKHTMGDTFCPIPGTLQGGFPVRFVPF